MNLLINFVGKVLHFIRNLIDKEEVKQWRIDKGDKTLRLNYDLNDSSIVFDLGGYEGQWASDIYSMYNCKIYIFEPVEVFSNKIKNRFKKNNKIKVFQLGLSDQTREQQIFLQNDSSSLYKTRGAGETIYLKKASTFLKEENIEKIDLMKINIEGGEYDLLDELIETNSVLKIKNLQIQFHSFVDNATNRRIAIQKNLEKTHKLTYCYDFVWENWELK